MKTYDKIYALGNKENSTIFADDYDLIVIEEKVDGANFRFQIVDGLPLFGTRTQNLNKDNMNSNFKRAVDFVTEKLKYNVLKDIYEKAGLVFFCENMIKHTIGYNWDITPPVIGYDIFSVPENKYLDEKKCAMVFKEIGIEFIPLVRYCTSKECRELLEQLEELVPSSKYVAMKAEGIVFKNYKKQIFAKFVRKEFKEKNEEVFGKTKRKTTNDEEFLVVVYCNNFKIKMNHEKEI
jgi:hypothetical protein